MLGYGIEITAEGENKMEPKKCLSFVDCPKEQTQCYTSDFKPIEDFETAIKMINSLFKGDKEWLTYTEGDNGTIQLSTPSIDAFVDEDDLFQFDDMDDVGVFNFIYDQEVEEEDEVWERDESYAVNFVEMLIGDPEYDTQGFIKAVEFLKAAVKEDEEAEEIEIFGNSSEHGSYYHKLEDYNM